MLGDNDFDTRKQMDLQKISTHIRGAVGVGTHGPAFSYFPTMFSSPLKKNSII